MKFSQYLLQRSPLLWISVDSSDRPVEATGLCPDRHNARVGSTLLIQPFNRTVTVERRQPVVLRSLPLVLDRHFIDAARFKFWLLVHLVAVTTRQFVRLDPHSLDGTERSMLKNAVPGIDR